MNESLDPTKENLNPEEVEIDKALRPLTLPILMVKKA